MKIPDVIYGYLTNRFVQSFFKAVKNAIPRSKHKEFSLKVKAHYREVFERNKDMIVDRPALLNLKALSMVYSSYQVLQNLGLKEDTVFEIIKKSLLQRQNRMIKTTYWMLKFFRIDLFNFVRKISKSKQIAAYGKGFSHEILEDNNSRFKFVVKRCFYYNFFVKEGAPRLTSIFCDYDNTWGDLINKSINDVRFERPQTIGRGGSCCEFNFIRISK